MGRITMAIQYALTKPVKKEVKPTKYAQKVGTSTKECNKPILSTPRKIESL